MEDTKTWGGSCSCKQAKAPLPQSLTGPKPKEIKVETFRIDYLIRGQKVEKLSLQPIRSMHESAQNWGILFFEARTWF